MFRAILTQVPGFSISTPFRFGLGGTLRTIRRQFCLLLMLAAPLAHAGPMVTLEAGLAQSAGAQFFVDPTALSFRIEASSSNRLTSLLVTVNGRDVTSRLVTLGRLSVAPEGTSGSVVAERLSLLALGVAGVGIYRVTATVSDTTGPTTIEATLSTGSVYAPITP
jgi:hypothetical protein